MRLTRIAAVVTFLSVAGAAQADWPFIKNNQIDDFTQPQQSATESVATEPSAAQADRATLPDCCAGMRTSSDAPAPVSDTGQFDGESNG
jgi:hypothetical protein